MKKLQKILVTLIISVFVFVLASCSTTEAPKKKVVDSDSGKFSLVEKFVFNGHIRGAQGLSFSNTQEHLASGGWDNQIFVWDTRDGTQFLNIANAHESDVVSIKYADKGDFFVSAGLDRTVKVWDARSSRLLKTFGGVNHNVIGVDVYQDRNTTWVAGAVLTGEVIIFDYDTGERYATFWHDSYATSVTFSTDGSILASTGNDNVVRLWNVANKTVDSTADGLLIGHTAKVNTVAFNSDASLIASGSWDNTVRVWDLSNGGQLLYQFNDVHTDAVEQVQFSPSGVYLVSGGRDGVVNVFEVATGANIVSYDTGNTRVYNVVFNKDASKIAVTGYDHTVRVYDITK